MVRQLVATFAEMFLKFVTKRFEHARSPIEIIGFGDAAGVKQADNEMSPPTVVVGSTDC